MSILIPKLEKYPEFKNLAKRVEHLARTLKVDALLNIGNRIK
jgi:hypothetical protein